MNTNRTAPVIPATATATATSAAAAAADAVWAPQAAQAAAHAAYAEARAAIDRAGAEAGPLALETQRRLCLLRDVAAPDGRAVAARIAAAVDGHADLEAAGWVAREAAKRVDTGARRLEVAAATYGALVWPARGRAEELWAEPAVRAWCADPRPGRIRALVAVLARHGGPGWAVAKSLWGVLGTAPWGAARFVAAQTAGDGRIWWCLQGRPVAVLSGQPDGRDPEEVPRVRPVSDRAGAAWAARRKAAYAARRARSATVASFAIMAGQLDLCEVSRIEHGHTYGCVTFEAGPDGGWVHVELDDVPDLVRLPAARVILVAWEEEDGVARVDTPEGVTTAWVRD